MDTEIITIEKRNSDSPWEGCINSVVYRIERGVPVEVPKAVAEIIRQSEQSDLLSSGYIRAFTRAGGMKLA